LKILITGDWHISERFDLEEIDRLLNQIKTRLVDYDQLWVLGDVFDSKRPTSREYLVLLTFLKSLKIPITIIAGNHDIIKGEYTTLDWLPYIFSNIIVYKSAQILEIEGIKILLGHYNIAESTLGAYDISIHSDVNYSLLDQQGIQLACLGHVHKFQVIKFKESLTVVHPGSLFYIDFGERNDQKKIVSLSIDKGNYTLDSIDLNPTPIYQFEFDVEKINFKRLSKLESTARVKIILNYSHPEIDKTQIKKRILDLTKGKEVLIVFHYKSSKLPGSVSSQKILPKKSLLETFFERFQVKSEIIQLIERILKDENIGTGCC